jgi:hypothetical protein
MALYHPLPANKVSFICPLMECIVIPFITIKKQL